jgi:tetratricopeptide (TPR) repeat protein
MSILPPYHQPPVLPTSTTSSRRLWIWVGGAVLSAFLLLCGLVLLGLSFLRGPLTNTFHFIDSARACEEDYQQGDLDESFTACNTTIAEHPDYAPAYITRGYIYMLRGEFQQALTDFDTALIHDPNNGQAFINRGITYEKMGNFQSALTNYNDMLSRDIPDSIHRYYGYNNRGVTYQNLGHIDSAIENYIRAIEQHPELPDAYDNLDRLILDKKSNDELLTTYTQLIDKHPNTPDIRYRRGMRYRMIGQTAQAYTDFQQCMSLKPTALLKQKIETQLRELEPLVK